MILYGVVYRFIMSEVDSNIMLSENLFFFNNEIIPKLLNHSLYLHSLTFPQIRGVFSDKKYNKIVKDFETFLNQSQCYLDTLEDSCQ